jgi:hypothetical protein
MKKGLRWKMFRVGAILQLICSGSLLVMVVIQSLRSMPKGDLFWIIAGWMLMLFALAGHAMLHLQIMNRYYPDRLVPSSLVILRIILSILSWISVVILSLAFIQVLLKYDAWGRSDLKLKLIYLTLLLVTIVSILELILQSGLIRHIRKNHHTQLLDSISQIGQPSSAYKTVADAE